jgi:O-antigen/teichoic acid export membrane protein
MTFASLLKAVAGSVGSRVAGAALGLMTQIILARSFSQDLVGIIFLTMSMAAILSLVVNIGYPALALTELPRFFYLGKQNLVNAFHAAALRDWAFLSVTILLLAVLAANFLPLDDGMKAALFFGLLSSPVSALLRYNSSIANSLKRFSVAYIPDNVMRPGLLLAFIAASLAIGYQLSLNAVLFAFVAANAIAAIAQAWILGSNQILPRHWHLSRPRFTKAVRANALSLAIVTGVATLFADIVTLLSGFLLPHEDVAVLGITIRLAAIAGFVIQTAQYFILPDLTTAFTARDKPLVHTLLTRLNMLTVVITICGFFGAVLLGGIILHIFGAQYASGHLLLVLFFVAQSIRAFSGMNQFILSLAGYQRSTMWACLLSLVVLVLSWIVLAPQFGLLGVGFAVVISELCWALLLAAQAHRMVGTRGDFLYILTHKSARVEL